MPKRRPPRELWQYLRKLTYERDKGKCQGPYCKDKPEWSIPFKKFHCDHIQSGKRGTNQLSNLRVLCRFCHTLRADNRHRGMIASALRDGVIPPDWRNLTWEG